MLAVLRDPSLERPITLIARPLEAFDNKIRAMRHLFNAAPAMTKHWALRIEDDVGLSLFEIGIQDSTQEIYATLPV